MGYHAPGGAVPVQYERSTASHVGSTYGPDIIACRTCYAKQIAPGCAGAGYSGTTLQVVPFQCIVRVLSLISAPTAQASFGPIAVTP